VRRDNGLPILSRELSKQPSRARFNKVVESAAVKSPDDVKEGSVIQFHVDDDGDLGSTVSLL